MDLNRKRPSLRIATGYMKYLVLLLLISINAFAAEPMFCDPAIFNLYRDGQQDKLGFFNDRTFQIGSITLVGTGVGSSLASSIQEEARARHIPESKKSCTWYLHNTELFPFWDKKARNEFNWHYVQKKYPDMKNNSAAETAAGYRKAMSPLFFENQNNFASCLIENQFLAFGCAGMLHRGPNMFAMLLGYLGCSPQHAAEIATQNWGVNGIPVDYRAAIAEVGAELGQKDTTNVQRILNLMSGETAEGKKQACDLAAKNDHRSVFVESTCRQTTTRAENILACTKVSPSRLAFTKCIAASEKGLAPREILNCQQEPTYGSGQRFLSCIGEQ